MKPPVRYKERLRTFEDLLNGKTVSAARIKTLMNCHSTKHLYRHSKYSLCQRTTGFELNYIISGLAAQKLVETLKERAMWFPAKHFESVYAVWLLKTSDQ